MIQLALEDLESDTVKAALAEYAERMDNFSRLFHNVGADTETSMFQREADRANAVIEKIRKEGST